MQPTPEAWPDHGVPLRVLDLLSEKLDPKLIARRKGPNGKIVRYLEGWQAIRQANKLFGYDNWGAELVGPIDYRELHHSTTKSGDIATRGLYTATVRVRVRGCLPKSDTGCAFTVDETAEAHETAVKAAVTDGIKRTFRQFGDQFANQLYERPVFGRTRESNELNDLRTTALMLGSQLGLDEPGTRMRVAARARRPFDELDAVELARVIRAMADALTKRANAA